MLSRIKFQIDGLVNLMLDHLPKEVWTSSTTRFLDPAIGGGQFVKEIERRLKEKGHTDINIKNRVFGFEQFEVNIRYAVNKNKLVGNYTKMSNNKFFEFSEDDKFDVIVGNPPYQDSNKTEKGGTTLWSVFIRKSIQNLVKDNGYVAMVTPNAWMSFGKSGQPMKNKQIHAVYTDIAHYFNAGSTFSAWILENTPTYKETNFVNEDLKIDLRNYNSLPAGRPIRGVSIVEKVMNWPGEWLEPRLERNIKGGWSERQKKFLGIDASLTKNKEYKYEVFHTNSLSYFIKDKPTDYDELKIIVSVSSPYPKVYEKPIGCAPGDLRTYILVDDKTQGDNIISYLNSKLFRFVWRKPGMISWKSLVLPKLENKTWNDKELYKLFGLTKEEIAIVEKHAL